MVWSSQRCLHIKELSLQRKRKGNLLHSREEITNRATSLPNIVSQIYFYKLNYFCNTGPESSKKTDFNSKS